VCSNLTSDDERRKYTEVTFLERILRDKYSHDHNFYTLPIKPVCDLKTAISKVKRLSVTEAERQINAANGDVANILSYDLPNTIVYCTYSSKSGFTEKATYSPASAEKTNKETKTGSRKYDANTKTHLIELSELGPKWTYSLWRSETSVGVSVVSSSNDVVELIFRSCPENKKNGEKNTQITLELPAPDGWTEGTKVKLCNYNTTRDKDLKYLRMPLEIQLDRKFPETVWVVQEVILFRAIPDSSWHDEEPHIRPLTFEFYDGKNSK
jgi:hypothetical protein